MTEKTMEETEGFFPRSFFRKKRGGMGKRVGVTPPSTVLGENPLNSPGT